MVLHSSGDSRLERVLSLLFLGDLMSVYLAVLEGVDPTPVEPLVRFKAALADAAVTPRLAAALLALALFAPAASAAPPDPDEASGERPERLRGAGDLAQPQQGGACPARVAAPAALEAAAAQGPAPARGQAVRPQGSGGGLALSLPRSGLPARPLLEVVEGRAAAVPGPRGRPGPTRPARPRRAAARPSAGARCSRPTTPGTATSPGSRSTPSPDAYVASIGAGLNLHPDFGSNPDYGLPYIVVPESQPRLPVAFSAAR